MCSCRGVSSCTLVVVTISLLSIALRCISCMSWMCSCRGVPRFSCFRFHFVASLAFRIVHLQRDLRMLGYDCMREARWRLRVSLLCIARLWSSRLRRFRCLHCTSFGVVSSVALHCTSFGVQDSVSFVALHFCMLSLRSVQCVFRVLHEVLRILQCMFGSGNRNPSNCRLLDASVQPTWTLQATSCAPCLPLSTR